ncbi:hypothetical protein IC582_008677 [Cucumis melo]
MVFGMKFDPRSLLHSLSSTSLLLSFSFIHTHTHIYINSLVNSYPNSFLAS